jgi:tetratricopeptide (TPR) repeat protein
LMAIEGSLSDVSLADICQLLALGRKTGCLTITDRSDFGYIYFKDGRVVHASVLNRPDRLGELLVKNGIIEKEALARAMEEQREEGHGRLGEILVRAGSLSRDALERWITIQIEEAVYHLFTWNQGSFHFNPDEMPDERKVFLVSLNADGLLMEGARRVDEWTLIERKIPSMDLIFKLVRDPLEQEGVQLSRNQKKLIPLLDGTRTVTDLVRDSGLVEFETGKALFELIQAGFVHEVGKKAQEGEKKDDLAVRQHVTLGQAFYKAGMLEDAAREFAEALKGDPAEPTSRFRLGLIALKSKDAGEAVKHFEAMPEEEGQGYGVLRNLALALERLGRFDEVIRVLNRANAARPGDADLILARGIAELKSGKPPEARSTFKKYRRQLGKKTPPPLYYNFAVLAAAVSGYLEEAISLGREGLRAYPAEASILVNTGAVLDQKGDHEAAEQYFLRALSVGSTALPQAHKNLGDQAYRRGDKIAAKTQYETAVKLDPSLGDDVYLKLGRIALEEADNELAILFLRRAMELNPQNVDARSHLENLAAFP